MALTAAQHRVGLTGAGWLEPDRALTSGDQAHGLRPEIRLRLVELLEREGPLAALAEARNMAGSGHGSVVLVSGEPGIGKTALVTRFADDLGHDCRVLWGTCDDLSIPRPLGPFQDLAGSTSGALARALTSGAPSHVIHGIVLDELEMPPRPTVLVLEDVHWADEATVDAITVIGRRIASLPALLILTFRGGEAGPDHPLHAALAAIRGQTSLYLHLAPLSRAAVSSLAGDDADLVYASTGGNPFYVTEMIAALPGELPPSVANAVLGRGSRLDEASRRLVEMVSMVPSRIRTKVLDQIMPGWEAAAVEPERRELLRVDAHHVQFRHELARAALRSSVPAARRRQLHAEILDALLATGAHSAEIVHHAEEAGNTEVVASHALTAARAASAVESNREAHAHYVRASEFADRLPLAEQARLYEELALASYTVDLLPEAIEAIERAIELNRELDDLLSVGRCTRVLSRCHWYEGDSPEALRTAHQAVEILEPLGESAELARAYSGLSQVAMLGANAVDTLEWGNRAVELAERLGDEAVKVHSLINIGSVRMQADPSDIGTLLEAHRLADKIGDRHEAVRALLNLGYSAITWVRPDVAWEYSRLAIAYAEEHQVDALLHYARVMTAWLLLREGKWSESELIAREVSDTGTSVAQLLAKTVLTELAIRRGDPDAFERLTDLADQAERTGELQRTGPVLQLETEWALTTGAPMPLARFDRAKQAMESAIGWAETTVAAWASVAGMSIPIDGAAPEPHAAMLEQDWAAAADAFGDVGWVYDRGLMLSLLDDESSLEEALRIARLLGATPLEQRVSSRMRELGMAVRSVPRDTTSANPAGLTPRQLEVFELLAQGLTNAEIAERLYVSVRTVEHHVEAILDKLGVSSRREAARRHAELGLV